MGGKQSTLAEETIARPRSYDSDQYKPIKNGKKHKSFKGDKTTENNNHLSGKYRPADILWPEYNITSNSDTAVKVHQETIEIILETEGQHDTPAVSPLKLDVMFETENRLHFKIYDPNSRRFDLQYEEFCEDYPKFIRKAQHTSYDVEYRNAPFGITVTRKATGHVLFDSCQGKLHFEDEKLHITTSLHSRYLYGLGEHQKRFLIDTTQPHNFVFWARDQPPQENHNLYGSHPFFISLEEDGHAYGVFLLNSCAMEVDIKPGEPSILSYTSNGGVLDFYVFTGPTPMEVIQQYQEVIGRPHLPPYWALGFHLSRWGYETVDNLQETIESNRKTKIPYESQWTDIDLLDEKQSWTYRDPALQGIVKNLHINGQKYVPIVDPGVSLAHNKQPAYTDGMQAGIFIQNYHGARPLVGKVWPGDVVFPDFSHPDIYEYWFRQAQNLYKNIPFDGLWLDMNEPANFVSGCHEDCHLTTSHSKDNPAYVPERLAGRFLFDKTVCPSAKQYQGFHYQLHNLYGHMQMKVSDSVCRKLRRKRTLIISRSTFPGSGKYGGHWTGDNTSSFKDLRLSISAMLDFNLFGIPLVGADVGGFWNTCDEELMIRWMQIGAFYPFMRNHNSNALYSQAPQDPAKYSMKAQAIMADIVCLRYSLLPYLYTLLFDNHTKGAPVVRPLFMLYPKDKHTYAIDDQFTWGSALLFSPCVTQGQTQVTAYFPYDIWYDFFTGCRLSRVGTDLNLHAPLDFTNIHIRGGSILITQAPSRNTSYSRNNPFGLLAALDSQHSARGKLYWDNGDVLDPIDNQHYNLIRFNVNKSCLTTSIEVLGHTECNMQLKLVQVFGLFVHPERVLVNGQNTKFTYTENSRVLQIDQIDISLKQPLIIEW